MSYSVHPSHDPTVLDVDGRLYEDSGAASALARQASITAPCGLPCGMDPNKASVQSTSYDPLASAARTTYKTGAHTTNPFQEDKLPKPLYRWAVRR